MPEETHRGCEAFLSPSSNALGKHLTYCYLPFIGAVALVLLIKKFTFINRNRSKWK